MRRHGLVENHLAVDVTELHRLKAFGHLTDEFPFVGLKLPPLAMMRTNRYAVEVQYAKDRRWQSIPVQWTRCHFGGYRPWLECVCRRRAGKLYDSGFGFACRQCLNLIYECQRRSRNGRLCMRLAKLRACCGGSPSIIQPFPEKPPRMHRRTYSKIKARAELITMELRRSSRFMKRATNYSRRA